MLKLKKVDLFLKKEIGDTSNTSFDTRRSCFDEKLILLIEFPLIVFFSSLAVAYIAFRVFGFFQWPFDFWAKSTLIITIISATLSIIAVKKRWDKQVASQICPKEALIVLLLVISGAVLAIIINRPDPDDSAYVPRALYYVEHASEALSSEVKWISAGEMRLRVPLFLSSFYELFQAAFCVLLGGHFLLYHHIIFPAIAGSLIVSSMFLLTNLLTTERRSTIFGVTVFLMLALMLGETHFTYGNSSFAQAFQGKYVFLTAGVSSWCYFSLKFLILRDKMSWLMLMLIGIGMASLTSTALPFVPLFSLIILMSYMANEKYCKGIEFPEFMFVSFCYLASIIPVAIMANEYREFANVYFTKTSFAQTSFPASFEGQMNLIIRSNAPFSVSLLLFLVSTLLVAIYSKFRIFLMVWIVFLFVFLLNPMVSDFVMKYFTTSSIYWRLFFLLPFPLVTVLLAAIVFPAINFNKNPLILAFFLISGFLFSIYWPQTVLRKVNYVTVEFPREKVNKELHSVATEILAKAPEGTMLSPVEISNIVVLLSSKFPQLAVLSTDMMSIFVSNNKVDESILRSELLSYLTSDKVGGNGIKLLEKFIDGKDSPVSVILPANGANNSEIIDCLSKRNYFGKVLSSKSYLLYVRNQ